MNKNASTCDTFLSEFAHEPECSLNGETPAEAHTTNTNTLLLRLQHCIRRTQSINGTSVLERESRYNVSLDTELNVNTFD